jgi:hypothetical protein
VCPLQSVTNDRNPESSSLARIDNSHDRFTVDLLSTLGDQHGRSSHFRYQGTME